MPFLIHFFFGWKGSPTNIDGKKGTLTLTPLLEDLGKVAGVSGGFRGSSKSGGRGGGGGVLVHLAFFFFGFFPGSLLGSRVAAGGI